MSYSADCTTERKDRKTGWCCVLVDGEGGAQ